VIGYAGNVERPNIPRASASFSAKAQNADMAVGYLPYASFTMPVSKDEYWQVRKVSGDDPVIKVWFRKLQLHVPSS
jgi:hypothetical protein